MFSRSTKINMKYSRFALVLEFLGWLLAAAVLVYVIQFYPTLDSTIAVGFDASGQAVEWDAKAVVLMQPIAAIFVYIVLTGIGIVMRRAVLPDEKYPVLERVLLAILGAKCIYLAYNLGRSYFLLNQLRSPAWLTVVPILAAVAVIVLTARSCVRCRRENL